MASAARPATTGLLDAFRKPDFNVAAFVRDATGQGHDRLGRLTQQLEDSASSLDEELQREIVACHEELLHSAGSVNDLDGQLGNVREVVEALKNSVARMRGDVLSPFGGVKRRTELLQHMQSVNDLIRKLRRFLYDARTLRTQMEGPRKDYSKAAHTLHELESALAEGSLERVDALRAEVTWIRDTGSRVRRQAEEDLRSGARQGNQITLNTALQVLFNLQILRPQLLRLTEELLQELANAQLVGGPGFQQSLVVNLQILIAQTQRIHLLDELVQSKTDPLTHRKFSCVLEAPELSVGSKVKWAGSAAEAKELGIQPQEVGTITRLRDDKCCDVSFASGKQRGNVLRANFQAAEGNITSLVGYFWEQATMTLKTKFSRLCQDRNLRKSLLVEFPKVLSTLAEASDKVSMLGKSRSQALRNGAGGLDRETLFASVGDLRAEYLQESIRRVTEPVEMMLPDRLIASLSSSSGAAAAPGAVSTSASNNASGDTSLTDELPTSHDLRRYAQLLGAELERSESCQDQVLKEALRNVRSSILFFATRLEQVVDSSCVDVKCFEDDARLRLRSPMPLPAAGHARNARLFGIAHHTLAALKDVIPARFQAQVVTQQVLTTLQGTQAAIVSPLLGGLRRAIQTSIALPPAPAPERSADGSAPLIAVGQAVSHVSRYYFALFGAGQLLPYLKDLCIFLIRSFLSAAVVVKPCTEATRQELLQDMQAVEMMLSAFDAEFQTHLRHEASVFKEFRKLLFSRSAESIDFEGLLNVIPLHLLLTYAVHQLPAEVPSLPSFNGVSPAAYFKDTLLLLWDEQADALASFKAKVGDLCDKHGLDPTESAVSAFVVAQSA